MKIIKTITLGVTLLLLLNTNLTNAKELEINKWQPTKISTEPIKKEYKIGDIVDITGLKIKFERYIKNSNKIEKQEKEVEMAHLDIKNGWLLTLVTPKINSIMDKEIKLKLTLISESMQYENLSYEKIEVDEKLNIIK